MSIAYYILFNALNDCGYSNLAKKTADAAIASITSIPKQSPSTSYAETFSKLLMTEFNTKALIGEKPEDQARYIANATLKYLKQYTESSKSATTSISSIATTDSRVITKNSNGKILTENSNAPDNSNSNTPDADKKLHTEVKFYEALYYYLYTSNYFKGIFNKTSSKFYAKSCAAEMLLNLYADYGDIALKTAEECVKRMSLLPANCNTEIYAKVIAICVSDVFSYYNLIEQDTPADQAKKIAAKMNGFLQQTINGKWQATTDSSAPQDTNIQDVPPNSQDNSNYPKISSSQPYSLDDYYNYYNDNDDSPTQTDQTPKQQSQQLNIFNTPNDKSQQPDSSAVDYSSQYPGFSSSLQTNQQKQKNGYYNYPVDYSISKTRQKPKQQNEQDYYYYYYYDSTSETNQRPKQPKQQTYSVPNDQQGYGTQNDGISNGGQQSISKASANASSSSDAKQNGPQNDTEPKGRNEYAKSPTNTNSNAVAETLQGNDDYPSEKSDSRNRIKYLMQQVLSSISNDKIDYKLLSRVIAAQAKFIQNLYPEWGYQKAQTTILVEIIIGLILRVQNCLVDREGNSDIQEAPDSSLLTSAINSPDQISAVESRPSYSDAKQINFNNDYQTGQQNANSIVQDNSAPLLIPLSQYSAATLSNVNNQQYNQGYSGISQNNWNSGYQVLPSNQNSIPPTQDNSASLQKTTFEYANQQGLALWPSTVGQANSNIPIQGTSVLNGQTNSFSTIPNSNLNPNMVSLNNQNNWDFSPQGGLNNQNWMQTGYQGNDGSIQTGSLNQNAPLQNTNMPVQQNQQNWGSSSQAGQ